MRLTFSIGIGIKCLESVRIRRHIIVRLRLSIGLERVIGNIVQSNHLLVGILHYQILPILLLHHDVHYAPQNTPCVVHVQIDLRRKLVWLVLLRTQNNVLAVISHLDTRYVAEFELIAARQKSLNGPLGQFACVVSQFVGEYCTTLCVQLLAPLDPICKF